VERQTILVNRVRVTSGTMPMVRCSSGRDFGGVQGESDGDDCQRYPPVNRVVLGVPVQRQSETSDQVAPNSSTFYRQNSRKNVNPLWNSVEVRFGCAINSSHDVIEGGGSRKIRRRPGHVVNTPISDIERFDRIHWSQVSARRRTALRAYLECTPRPSRPAWTPGERDIDDPTRTWFAAPSRAAFSLEGCEAE
jgi:hypothetical protein